jgi:hypothetical protein
VLTLILVSATITGVIIGMKIYLKSHLPDASPAGLLSLQQGLSLGTISAVLVLILYGAMLWIPPISRLRVLPLMFLDYAGNILNLIAIVSCLRELTAEGLFVATVIALNQVLWILHALRVVTAGF